MEEQFSPYGTQSEIMWPSSVGSLEVERATSDASAITLPIGSRRQTIDENSLRTVDMAGRILNYWRPQGEGNDEKLPPEVLHEPPDKKDQDSVSSAETEPFDVVNERRKTEAENAAKGPITKFSEYFDDKLTTARTDSVIETKRPPPKLNLDALRSRGGTSVVETQSDYGAGSIGDLSAFNFNELSSVGPDSPHSDPGTPDSEFQKRLRHRRRLQRIRVLAAYDDDTSSQASFHSTGTPTKLRERRDRVQKEQKRRKSFGYEDPLMRPAENLETLPEEEEGRSKTPGLTLAEDEYSLFSYEQASETQSPKANQTQSPSVDRTQSPLVNRTQSPSVDQTQSPLVDRTQSPSVDRTQNSETNRPKSPQANQIQSLNANQTPSPKATRPKLKTAMRSRSATRSQTPTIDEDRELPDLPANLDRLNFEKIVGNETIFSSTSKHDNDTASVRSGYIKSVSSEVHDAIKDVLFLGDETETRPGLRKRSNKRKKTKDYFKRQKYVATKGTHQTLPDKNEETQKGGMWKELAFTLGLSPEDDDEDDDDDDTKYTVETQSIITKSPASHSRQMEQESRYSSNPPRYSSNPASPERHGNPIIENSTYDINQLQTTNQQRATQPDIFEGFPFPVSSLNSDHDFVLLALFAAQAVHELQGVRFDDSYPLDMYEDLKISVVELKMPLGLILMENAGGCFVTKIVADGSAARSGGVKVGDQLAAINGQKCLKMRVEDIYKIILTTPEPVIVQLAFIRYIGPFRPETQFNEEENSVIDNTQPRQTLRVVKDVSRKPSSDRRKIRNWFRKLKGKNA